MGLASKMAAANQNALYPPQGPPPSQPPMYAPPPGGPPPLVGDTKANPANYDQKGASSGSYAPPSGPPPFQAQPGTQYAAGQQHQPTGGVPEYDVQTVERVLQQCVRDQNISTFYPPGSLGPIAQKIVASRALEYVQKLFKLERESALNLAKLALFDIVLLLDDSGSMAFKSWHGERLDDLNLVLSRVATAASLFDDDGIAVRFLNSTKEGNHIKSERDAMELLNGVEFLYQTPLGGALSQKILNPMLLGPASAGRLQKPLSVIIITDGSPSDGDLIIRVIRDASQKLKRSPYGSDALSIQIAQVGTDLEAQEFLGRIDEDREVGDLVDCTSNYESEADEMKKKTGQELTPEGWLVKLLMGGIDSSYDAMDESGTKSSFFGGMGGFSSSSGGAAPKKTSKFKSLFGKK